ncbi:hypothetical protein [Mongoliibacter ruber]|uniref:Uncharacterized protein n=1 Tax=Mongoliibacter ruber TaxID=1750599 RepID=A0A2T0WVG6_9BACT|nr:hypothetical protein [Mongoliibacter ruber]PRY90685.1 hypothetical protein CLW00_101350 [Mongoliibacter ruber]
MRIKSLLSFLLLTLILNPDVSAQNLKIESLGESLERNSLNIIDFQDLFSTGGSTSLRNNQQNNLIWKNQGYFQRNRDLGQVFQAPANFEIKAIILRTGPSTTAILENTPGTRVFIQLFEVFGTPVIHENDTQEGNQASHGFTENHKGDDYIAGISYKSIAVIRGGIFPEIAPTLIGGKENSDQSGKLHYLKFLIEGLDYKFKKDKRYAFLIGFEDEGENVGFTLANFNRASHDDIPSLNSPNDPYPAGWGIRREGNGENPPTLAPDISAPTDKQLLNLLIGQSLFPNGNQRFRIPPTTDGYPDVDTYRDLEFYIEALD